MKTFHSLLSAALVLVLAQQQPQQPATKGRAATASVDGHVVGHRRSKAVAKSVKKEPVRAGARAARAERANPIRTPAPTIAPRAKPVQAKPPA